MKDFQKIAAVNLIILVLYSIIIRVVTGGPGTGNDAGLGILVLSAIVIILHVFVNLVIMVVYYAQKNNELGKAWLFCSGLVLLVGFSTCLGNAML
jgi:hypothetical protein